MKILHIITDLDTGGAETALCRLLESLPPSTFRHEVVVLSKEGALSERVRESGAHITHLNMNPGRPNPLALRLLRKVLHINQPDLIHGWMYHANLAAALAAFNAQVPVLWGIRQSLYDLSSEKPLTRVVIRACARLSRCPHVVVYNARVSAAQHETLGYRQDKTRIIPNGFDTGEFRPDADRRMRIRAELGLAPSIFAVGLIARFHPVKDHDSFLRAAVLFAQTHPQVVFVLVGDNVDARNHALVKRVQTLGLSDRMRLCGRRQDIAALNTALDVATSSSWSEAFPNVIGEAMACTVPCVTTDVGDAHEIVGETGFLVPPRDPEALCAGWTKLAEMEEAARLALGQKARRRIIERYALTNVSRQYANLYRQAVVA